MSWLDLRYYRLQQIQQLDPVTDHCLICHLLTGYEFPWDTTRSLELALLKTYCVPSISQLLDRTGEFRAHTQKRYDDTGLLVAEIVKWGYDSERGIEAIRRMNAIHAHYPISNEDFLYVLSTFIYEPIRWNERFGWRLFCETEKLAIFYFWQAIGKKMDIHDIPSTYEEFAQYNQNYEQQHFVYSDSNRRVVESTINLFLSWFPAIIRPLLRPCVYGIFDELTLTAFGYSNPPAFVRNLVENSLKLHGHVSKWLLPRRKPDFFTDSKLRSYPHGYQLNNLGPTKMLDKLNRLSTKE
jgi:hypothetical protein